MTCKVHLKELAKLVTKFCPAFSSNLLNDANAWFDPSQPEWFA